MDCAHPSGVSGFECWHSAEISVTGPLAQPRPPYPLSCMPLRAPDSERPILWAAEDPEPAPLPTCHSMWVQEERGPASEGGPGTLKGVVRSVHLCPCFCHLPWTTVKMEVHSHLDTGLQCQHYGLIHHLHLTADTQTGSLMICTCLLTL